MNNVSAAFGVAGAKYIEPHAASNMAQGMSMVVTEDVTIFGGLLGGKSPAGVMVAESKGPAVVASEVGNASRSATATEMAGELSTQIGKNSVRYTTPNKTGHIDLKGKSHFDKATGQNIPTPHVQERSLNYCPRRGTSKHWPTDYSTGN